MAETLGVIRPPVQAVLDKLKDVPVDIEPRYVTAQQLETARYDEETLGGKRRSP
jgi:hypothetical protein